LHLTGKNKKNVCAGFTCNMQLGPSEVVWKMKDDKDKRLQEVPREMPESEPAADCDFCNLLCGSAPGKSPSDPTSLHFMTERELQVLASMRRLKQEVSEIKASMREMEQQGILGDGSAHPVRLADLRAEWKKMDKERMDAAEERMRLLGHIQ
jgi:hypothetical protein